MHKNSCIHEYVRSAQLENGNGRHIHAIETENVLRKTHICICCAEIHAHFAFASICSSGKELEFSYQ